MQGAGIEGNCGEKSSDKQQESIDGHNHPDSPEIQQECVVDEENRWRTVTHESYQALGTGLPKSLGRRRELVKNFIGLRVLGETINAITADPPPQPISPSEYVDNFCDSKFIPFMNRTEYDTRKHAKYPLHGGATAQSYYKCQLDRGTLKARLEILDLNQPFRRSCSFTTPPDLALREPTGGY